MEQRFGYPSEVQLWDLWLGPHAACCVCGHRDEGNYSERVCCFPKVAAVMRMDNDEKQISFLFFFFSPGVLQTF